MEDNSASSSSATFITKEVENYGTIEGNIYVGGTHNHPPEPSIKLPKAWNLPSPNISFVERQEFTKALEEYFFSNEKRKPVVLAAMAGLGGVGKTELAKDFLHSNKNKFTSCIWLNAENEAGFLKEYRKFSWDCGIRDEKNIKDISRRLNDYLAKNSGWLMVIDNAELREKIECYLPPTGGLVLVTSRRSDWNAKIIPVDILTPDQARKMYFELSGRPESEAGVVDELMKEGGYLPLAVAQMAAFVKNTSSTTEQYLERFKNDSGILEKNELPADTTEKANRLNIMTTWNLSIEVIEKELEAKGLQSSKPDVRTLLVAISYLHANNIPRSFLDQWALDNYLKEGSEHVGRVIASLKKYSLIQEDEKQAIAIHRLVQDTARYHYEKRDKNMMGSALEVYPNLLIQLLNSMEKSFLYNKLAPRSIVQQELSLLVSHVTSLVDHIARNELKNNGFIKEPYIKLVHCLALYHELELSNNNIAIALLTPLLDILPETGKLSGWRAATYHQLGNSYFVQTNFEEARKFYQKALDFVFSPDDNTTDLDKAVTLHQIGNTLSRPAILMLSNRESYDQGIAQLGMAKDYYEKSLEINKPLADSSPSIRCNMADNYHELANILSICGKHEDALKMIENVLNIKTNTLQSRFHTDVAITLELWGLILQRAGRLQEASEKYQEALAICKINYDEKHSAVIRVKERIQAFVHETGISVPNDSVSLQQYLEITPRDRACIAEYRENRMGRCSVEVGVCWRSSEAMDYESELLLTQASTQNLPASVASSSTSKPYKPLQENQKQASVIQEDNHDDDKYKVWNVVAKNCSIL